jgi:hypothetical protein
VALIENTLRIAHLPLHINRRHATRERVADLVDVWGYCSMNRRRTLFDACLLVDAPHSHSGCRLHPEASQNMAVTLYLYKQHIKTHMHIHSQTVNLHTLPIEIIHSIIFINQILNKLYHFNK